MSLFAALAEAAALRKCDRVGRGVRLTGAPWIENEGRLELGDEVKLVSLPVQSHLVVAEGAALLIGARVTIQQGAAIACHAKIEIGEGSWLGDYVSIADTDFHVAGEREARPQTTPIVIGKNVRIGARCTILRGALLGDGAQVAAGSVVGGTIPAGVRVGGVPAAPLIARGDRDAALGERVLAVLQGALGLAEPPAQGARLDSLEAWTSLGALKLLLALEQEFEISLREESVVHAPDAAALIGAIESALAAR